MKEKLIAIVDPYSSGALLAPEFLKHGFECLMIQSSLNTPDVFSSSYNKKDFKSAIQHDGEIENTLSRLECFNIEHIIAGCELGVELADELGHRLNLLSNGTCLSKARRDKLLMMQMLKKNGIRTPLEYGSNQIDRILEWIDNTTNWPVIMKPARSTSSDGLHLCHTQSDVRIAFENIIDKKNILGLMNNTVLVQEFLQGTEYIVDTVSVDGRHKVAAFWKYGKPRSSHSFVCYNTMELLPYAGRIQEKLFAYVSGVLDALDIRHGPAHSEMILVENNPVLVETGARMTAGINATISQNCAGICQLDLVMQAYLEPRQFIDNIDNKNIMTKRAANYFLMPERQGTLKSLARLTEIKRLKSLHKMSITATPCHPVPRIAGIITLVHEKQDVIEHDLEKIRNLELNGLYEFQ